MALLPAMAAGAAEHHGRVFFGTVPVPGATVTATRDGKTLATVTDEQGVYQFADIADGAWHLRVEMPGFGAVDRDVAIAAATPAGRWDLKMLPLAEILAAASRQRTIVAPALVPRVAAKPTATEAKTDTAASAAAPVDENAAKSADALLISGSESNAATSKYNLAPAFGNRRANSKSLYNGSIGAIVGQSIFDARPYSLTGLPTPKGDYSRVTIVATLGGPLNIPPLMRHGPNFFLAYQWTRNREASTISGLVPTAAQRNGDLRGTLDAQGNAVAVNDPITGNPLTGVLPVSAQARALLALYPLPNLAGSTRYNYQTQVLNATHADTMQLKLDKSIGKRDQVYGGFALKNLRGDTENLFAFRDATKTLGIDTNVHWSHRFPHHILLDTGYRFSRLRTDVLPYFQNRQNVSGAAGITGNAQDPRNYGPPDLVFSSIYPLSDGISAFNRNRTDALTLSATWTHGRHVTTFGGDLRRQSYNQLQQSNPRGSFTFTGAATRGNTANGGSDIADFLLGVPDASRVAFGNADKYFRQTVLDGFVSDDWRLKPELTITAGMRWDYGAPMSELFGRLVNLDIAPGFAAVRPVLGNDPTGSLTGTVYPSSLVRPDRRKFQPRVSIALRPDPTSTMVIRAGYGIYVDTSVYLASVQQMAQQSPLSKSVSVSNSSACPLTLANGFRNCAGTTANTFAIDPNFRVGYAQVWNLSVQRDLPGSMVLTGTYSGVKGTRGPQQFLPNTYPIGGANPCPQCPTGFVYRTSNGASIRHAAQVQLRRRLRSGLAAQIDYTYAHSIDNDSELGGAGHVVGSTSNDSTTTSSVLTSVTAQNWRDLRAERSNSSFDQRHLLSAQVQYTSGMGMHAGTLMTGWSGRLLKEWTVSAKISAGTGLPETPVYLAAVPGTGVTGTLRANRNVGVPVNQDINGYHLNAAAYATPGAGQWGNAGRNSMVGPSQFSLDSSLARTFRVRDKLNLDVRMDAENLLNHPVYTMWSNITNSTTFGLPVNTNDMRTMQLTGRLRF
ncbi:hypothetical protein Terro_4335 [Terriglobus roseus DSM 18391]|uniref:TonB-dependent transporter Oar-like beta-barrel domain-containing protein n=2 Tax=Terriglobus roseus TaxID=392734 RepID=I3ZMR4_TERRK|nr:hypothetical protein Terro_4335 [Terriglobus roseus DSM 18391]